MYKLWLTAGIVSAIFILVFIAIVLGTKTCKPHCRGNACGPGSNDGCGNPCSCQQGGLCQNGTCCYQNCDGVRCGNDPCKTGQTCGCDRLPNGICQGDKCCYKQSQNNYYCGPDGCGGTIACAQGQNCSSTESNSAAQGPGICYNSGTPGWTYSLLGVGGAVRTNTSSAEECAKWVPEDIKLNLSTFPCKTDSDCPYNATFSTANYPCPDGKNCPFKSVCDNGFCTTNNVYGKWSWDPNDPSGYSCTKILEGVGACAVPKAGASAFNVTKNISPDQEKCDATCTISAICPPTGPGACCPEKWSQKSNGSSICIDDSGKGQCCVNNPSYADYKDCIASGLPSCEAVPNVWWKGNQGEISASCSSNVTGPDIGINAASLQNNVNLLSSCAGKNTNDSCTYDDTVTKFTGNCVSCLDGKLRCMPGRICVQNGNISAGSQGICSSPVC